jgi:hypothetical protein
MPEIRNCQLQKQSVIAIRNWLLMCRTKSLDSCGFQHSCAASKFAFPIGPESEEGTVFYNIF